MSWFKKKLYTKGPGSPGATAKAFAKSYKECKMGGMNSVDASDAVLQNYFSSYERMGINVTDDIKNISGEIEGDPVIAVYVLILLGNSNNPSTIQKIKQDASLILEIIINEQNKILFENRTLSEIESKMEKLNH